MIDRYDGMLCIMYELNGQKHRSTGPAIIWRNAHWSWHLNGKDHRYYGPQNNDNEWWMYGVNIK